MGSNTFFLSLYFLMLACSCDDQCCVVMLPLTSPSQMWEGCCYYVSHGERGVSDSGTSIGASH